MINEKRQELKKKFDHYYEVISSILNQNVKKEEAQDIPEFIAYEVIDLIEWVADYELQPYVAKKLIREYSMDKEAQEYIKKYFSLWKI
jgi:hypothetical protein